MRTETLPGGQGRRQGTSTGHAALARDFASPRISVSGSDAEAGDDLGPWKEGSNPSEAVTMSTGWGRRASSAGRRGRQLLNRDDWREIDKLLSKGGSQVPPASSKEATIEAIRILRRVRGWITSQVLPAGLASDWMLDIWAAVHGVNPVAARPAEQMLVALVGRDLATADEIRTTCDEIEGCLLSLV